MLDDHSSLSSDLEWMLQTNQVSAAVVVDSLVREYGQRIQRLAYLLLGQPALARRATDQTILALLFNRSRFPAGFDIHAWVLRTTLQSCQSIHRQRLTEALRARLPRRGSPAQGQPVDFIQKDHEDSGFDWQAYSRPSGGLVDQEVRATMAVYSMSDRALLALYYLERLPLEELAQVMGGSSGKLRYHLRSMNERLLRRLSGRICELGACGGGVKQSWWDISHLRFQVLVRDLQDGSLENEEKARLAEHLAGCAACSSYAQRLELLGQLVAHALEHQQFATFDMAAAVARILSRLEQREQRTRLLRKAQQALAGSAILGLVIAAGWMANAMNLVAPPTQKVVNTVVVTESVQSPGLRHPHAGGFTAAGP